MISKNNLSWPLSCFLVTLVIRGNCCFTLLIFFFYQMRHPFELECQVDKSDHFQHILLCGLTQRQKAEKDAPGICAMYENVFITDRKKTTKQNSKGFLYSRRGRLISDSTRSVRPVQFYEN